MIVLAEELKPKECDLQIGLEDEGCTAQLGGDSSNQVAEQDDSIHGSHSSPSRPSQRTVTELVNEHFWMHHSKHKHRVEVEEDRAAKLLAEDPLAKARRPTETLGFDFGTTYLEAHVSEGVHARRMYENSLPDTFKRGSRNTRGSYEVHSWMRMVEKEDAAKVLQNYWRRRQRRKNGLPSSSSSSSSDSDDSRHWCRRFTRKQLIRTCSSMGQVMHRAITLDAKHRLTERGSRESKAGDRASKAGDMAMPRRASVAFEHQLELQPRPPKGSETGQGSPRSLLRRATLSGSLQSKGSLPLSLGASSAKSKDLPFQQSHEQQQQSYKQQQGDHKRRQQKGQEGAADHMEQEEVEQPALQELPEKDLPQLPAHTGPFWMHTVGVMNPTPFGCIVADETSPTPFFCTIPEAAGSDAYRDQGGQALGTKASSSSSSSSSSRSTGSAFKKEGECLRAASQEVDGQESLALTAEDESVCVPPPPIRIDCQLSRASSEDMVAAEVGHACACTGDASEDVGLAGRHWGHALKAFPTPRMQPECFPLFLATHSYGDCPTPFTIHSLQPNLIPSSTPTSSPSSPGASHTSFISQAASQPVPLTQYFQPNRGAATSPRGPRNPFPTALSCRASLPINVLLSSSNAPLQSQQASCQLSYPSPLPPSDLPGSSSYSPFHQVAKHDLPSRSLSFNNLKHCPTITHARASTSCPRHTLHPNLSASTDTGCKQEGTVASDPIPSKLSLPSPETSGFPASDSLRMPLPIQGDLFAHNPSPSSTQPDPFSHRPSPLSCLQSPFDSHAADTPPQTQANPAPGHPSSTLGFSGKPQARAEHHSSPANIFEKPLPAWMELGSAAEQLERPVPPWVEHKGISAAHNGPASFPAPSPYSPRRSCMFRRKSYGGGLKQAFQESWCYEKQLPSRNNLPALKTGPTSSLPCPPPARPSNSSSSCASPSLSLTSPLSCNASLGDQSLTALRVQGGSPLAAPVHLQPHHSRVLRHKEHVEARKASQAKTAAQLSLSLEGHAINALSVPRMSRSEPQFRPKEQLQQLQ